MHWLYVGRPLCGNRNTVDKPFHDCLFSVFVCLVLDIIFALIRFIFFLLSVAWFYSVSSFPAQPSKLEVQWNRELKYHNDTNVIYCIRLSSKFSQRQILPLYASTVVCRKNKRKKIWFFCVKLALTFLCMLNKHLHNRIAPYKRIFTWTMNEANIACVKNRRNNDPVLRFLFCCSLFSSI